ncbi:hypothetical protein E1171_00930 [Cytophagales bacterium RKSG123]|nr:hypothetical protein [Xanthovirga aplysinae]
MSLRVNSNLYTIICIFTFLTSCKKPTKVYFLEHSYEGFKPIPPIDYDTKKIIQIDSVGHVDTVYLPQLFQNKKEILDFLPNETVLVTISTFDESGNVVYLGNTVSESACDYVVTMDYVKYTTVKVITTDSLYCIGLLKIGVGIRLTANITTFKANLNIGDLGAIGVAADENNLTGTLLLDVVGIESKDITSLIPLPKSISLASIQDAVEAIIVIKNKIYEDGTKIEPQVIAVKKVGGDCPTNSLLKTLYKTVE